MPYLAESSGIVDANGDNLTFAVTLDGQFLLSLRDDQSGSGWREADLGRAFGDFQAHCLAVTQNRAKGIFIAVSGVDSQGATHVFSAGPLPADRSAVNWDDLGPVWRSRLDANPHLQVTTILLGTDDDDSAKPPILIVGTTERGPKTPKYFLLQEGGGIVQFPRLDNADQIIDIQVGAVQRRGVFSLYRVANDYVLDFTGVPDEFNVPLLLRLTTPPGAMTLHPEVDKFGKTDLKVKGNGVFLFPWRTMNRSFVQATQIAEDAFDEPRITSRSALAQEFDPGTRQFRDVYRASITFPAETNFVDVWAAEQTTIETHGEFFTIDPVQPVRLQPDSSRRVIISIPAASIGCPVLRLHTNNMRPEQLFFVFPDAELHQTLTSLPEGALAGARGDLGVGHLSEDECDHVQKTIQSLSKTVQHTYNRTPHGIHHDRALRPANMDDAHFRVDFDGGRPRYQAMDQNSVLAATSDARRLDSGAAQGFFDDVGSFFQQAGSIIVHTAEKVGNDIAQTAENVGRDAIQTFDKVGDDLVHGDVFSIGKDLLQGGENLGKDLVQGAMNVAGDVLAGAKDLLVVTLRFAGQAVQFVLDHTGVVGKFIRALLDKIGAAVNGFIKWLMKEIGWDDVLHTHDVVRDVINKSIDTFASLPQMIQDRADEFFGNLRANVDLGFQAAQAAIGAPVTEPSPDVGFSAAMEKFEWLFSKIMDNMPSLNFSGGLAGAIGGGGSMAIPPELEQLAAKMTQKLGDGGEVVIDALVGASESFKQATANPMRAIQVLLSALLKAVNVLVDLGIELLKEIVDVLLELAADAFDSLSNLINGKITIPFLSDFYSFLTNGRDLSLMSVTSLLIALPATLIAKAMDGHAPFAQAAAADAKSTAARDLQIINAVAHIPHSVVCLLSGARGGMMARSVGGGKGVSSKAPRLQRMMEANPRFTGALLNETALASLTAMDVLLSMVEFGTSIGGTLATTKDDSGHPGLAEAQQITGGIIMTIGVLSLYWATKGILPDGLTDLIAGVVSIGGLIETGVGVAFAAKGNDPLGICNAFVSSLTDILSVFATDKLVEASDGLSLLVWIPGCSGSHIIQMGIAFGTLPDA